MSSGEPAVVVTKARRGIFPGWWLVIAGGIMCFWGYGIHLYAFGAYVKELIKSFGFTRAQVSLAYSFNRLEGGIEGPFGGLAIDKWGPRVVNFAGFVMFGGGLCAMYFVNSLWHFYVVWIITSIGANLGLSETMDAAMANWWVKRRGLMISIMRSIIAFSGVMIAAATWLLYIFGWRYAFPILGIGSLVIGLPLTWFFIKPKRPEYYGWLPDGKRVEEVAAGDTSATIDKGVEYATEATGEVEFTVRQAIRGRVWWICALSMTLRGMAAPVVNVHMIPYLTDMGIDPMVAAAAMGTFVFMTAPGRLLFGWLGDIVRLNQLKYMVILAHLLEALGLFLIIRATNVTWLWVALGVYGLGHGASIMIWPPLRGRYWGRKAYATIQGAMLPITMIGGIIAPVYAGWAYDTTGTYMTAFKVLLSCVVISAVVMYFAPPPKRPEKIGKITEVV